MSADDYNMNDYMSFETNVYMPVNYVPYQWGSHYPQYGFMFPQNPLGMAQAAAQVAMLQTTAKAAQAAQALAQKIPPLTLPISGGRSTGMASTATGIKEWLESGKYDFPYGEDIDFFHNRICFDKVCKHDPEMTNDLATEWLRRSIPIAPYKPAPPKPQPLLMQVPKPLQRYSLIPYEDVSKGKVVCGSQVRMPNRSPIYPSLSPMNNVGNKQNALGLIKISSIPIEPTMMIADFPEIIKKFL